MYDDLITRLRVAYETDNLTNYKLLQEAADAIERLDYKYQHALDALLVQAGPTTKLKFQQEEEIVPPCPNCDGRLSEIRYHNGRAYRHCYSCHFEFYEDKTETGGTNED